MPALGSDSAETEIFDFDVFVHAVLGAFAAEAGFFYAAEGRNFRGNDSGVDADDAVFERLSDAPDPSNVAAVEISSETKLRIVRKCDSVGFFLESEERRDGTE